MNELLQAKIKESRAHLAELRALRNPGQTQLPIVSQEISEIVVKILNTNTGEPVSYVPETDETGQVIDLASRHNITPEVEETVGKLIEQTLDSEFEERAFLEELEKGVIIQLGLKEFDYFKIVKLSSTEGGNGVFVIHFKHITSKPAQTTLILKTTFPLKAGNGMYIISPRTQKQLGGIHTITSVKINTKNVLEKMLEKLGF